MPGNDTPSEALPLALVVEDNDSVARVFRAATERAGFRTEVVSDGQAALDRLGQLTPCLIVLDVHLPFVSGREILQFIRAQPRLAGVCVVLATADLAAAQDLRPQVEHVLEKPCGFLELHELAKSLRTQWRTSPDSPSPT